MTLVFGYGSLVDCGSALVPCHLDGHRRRWNVAMDNSVDLPGYKCYIDPATGKRPPVFVTFVNLEPVAGSAVNGIAFAVTGAALTRFDERERNYERRDVTALIREDLGEPVCAFVGRPGARERFERAHRAGRAVVSRDYYAGVLDGFAALGDGALAEFRASTDEPQCPVVELTRVELP